MPLLFSCICILLSRLEDIETADPPLLPADKQQKSSDTVESWFRSHRSQIDQLSAEGISALLSTFLPEWRTDRVYGIQDKSLYRILCRTLRLGQLHMDNLQEYKKPGHGDLAMCLERVMESGGPPATPPATLEQVDGFLEILAGRCSFSSRQHMSRNTWTSSEARDEVLGDLLKRMEPAESKWLIRIILKDLSPLRIHEELVLRSYHFLLPDLLKFQRSFHAAATLLKGQFRDYPERPDRRSEPLLKKQAMHHLRPVVGTKVGRPTFCKSWSIDHCLSMLGSESWTLERKYDGEYCEIHVDLGISTNPVECIQIFSKTGKDSTLDRIKVHQIIIDSLQLGNSNCKFKKQAIFLGELVAFSDRSNGVLPFEEIRKHVSRSGRFLGIKKDLLPRPYEHLAVVFFDLLLLDDEVVMNQPVEERRIRLRTAYKKIAGRAIGAEWKAVDFSKSEDGRKILIEQFSASNAKRCEGLVLKRCGVPYFSLEGSCHNFIKLKKDYIKGMGDEADFAVIGASYDAQRAAISRLPGIKFTSFHLGCLTNMGEILKTSARPIFKYVGTVEQSHCIPKPVLEAANVLTTFASSRFDCATTPTVFDIASDSSLQMDVVIHEPFIFEILGSGFAKPPDCDFLMLRHPRVKKLHEDRTWRDSITFQALQEQGREARAAPIKSELSETLAMIERLEASCRRKFDRERGTTSKSGAFSTQSASKSTTSGCVNVSEPHEVQILDGRENLRPCDLESRQTRSSEKRHLDIPSPTPESKRPRNNASLVLQDKSPKTKPLTETTHNMGNCHSRISLNIDLHSTPVKGLSSSFVSRSYQRRENAKPATGDHSTRLCEVSHCLFSHAVVYLTPCIAHTLYITEDLLAIHEIETITSLSHWNRESYAHPPLAEVVSESQSHHGMRKIVLVEMKRQKTVQAIVKEVRHLNGGQFRERVELYDWRVLEYCRRHDRGAEELKRHFLGATMFDDTQKRALFVTSCEWIDG